MEIQQQAIRKLANSMRIYVENHINFQRLKNVDPEEAVENLDRAFESKLEAFHSLYDVSKEEIDYFSHGDTSTIILLRNALHHRNHFLFRSMYQEMILNDGHHKHTGAEFLLVNFDVSDSPARMSHFYKLEDFYKTLAPSHAKQKMNTKMREMQLKQLDTDLHFSEIRHYADQKNYPINQIYINLIPIFISATCRAFTALKQKGVEFVGFDAQTYEDPFTDELNVDFSKISYQPLRIL